MYNYVDYDSMKRYKRISRLLIVLGVIALIIFNNSIFEIFIGMSILGVAGYFQWKYEDQYKDQILLPVIRSIFPNSNFSPIFMLYYIKAQSEFLKRQAVGAAQPNISQGTIQII